LSRLTILNKIFKIKQIKRVMVEAKPMTESQPAEAATIRLFEDGKTYSFNVQSMAEY